jgi:glutamyl-tRNA reductase
MFSYSSSSNSKFFIAGINYKKSDASVRGMYAINKDRCISLFAKASQFNISSFFILSTCNRTEIYGFADDALSLGRLLCSETDGEFEIFYRKAYFKSGNKAVEHLFQVAAGLDSQILGDYEIVGQLKDAIKLSKKMNGMNTFMERLVNSVLQSAKNIRTNTSLSGGTVSVSFAAVQYIKENVKSAAEKSILLVGTGKIGRNTCRNLIDYLCTKNITLINRTDHKAVELAKELGLQSAPKAELINQLQIADIILVASNDTEPVIQPEHIQDGSSKLIIDLSIPYNVEPAVGKLACISLVNIDELSKIKDETLQMRMGEVPKAKEIINRHMVQFSEWNQMRLNVPVLKAVKAKLQQLDNSNMYIAYSSKNIHSGDDKEEKIQKVINGMAKKMRRRNQQGCYYIEALNEYIATAIN